MKKFLALFVMAVALALPSGAQTQFGLTAGVNMSNISVNDVAASIKSRTGFFVGPTVKFTLPIIGLGIDAAALYDQREGKVEDQTFQAQSIQIPINVRYGFGLGSLAEIFLFAGPQFGFNIGSDKTFKGTVETIQNKWTLKSSNLSANIGIGATVVKHLQVKVNYNFALGKTGEFKVNDVVKGNAKFSTWQASLAYYF